MTIVIETQLAARLKEKLDHEDERAKETMAAGMLQGFDEYKFQAGYRKALADAQTLLAETLDEIMKE
jgi:hypothetical protein